MGAACVPCPDVGEDARGEARRRAAIRLGDDCVGWARAAHFLTAVADDGDTQLRSEAGAPTRYFVRRRRVERLELTQTEDGEAEHPLLFVAAIEVLQRYLIGLFADDIRADLDLPMLDQPWQADDLAAGYELTEMVRGYRTLRRVSGEPIAAAPDPTLSMLALVPLSHYLGWSIPDLKRSFLSYDGAPLMRDGRYAVP